MVMNKDEATGKVEKAVGDLTDDHELHRQGEADEAAGKVKSLMQGAEDVAEDLVDKVKGAFHRDK